MKKFELNNNAISLLQNKSRLYSYLTVKLDKAYIKLEGNSLIFALCNNRYDDSDNILITTVNMICDEDFDEPVYFSVDYSKWQVTLQKFSSEPSIRFVLNGSTLLASVDNRSDKIYLSVNFCDSDSQVANEIDYLFKRKSQQIIDFGNEVEITDKVMYNLEAVNSLYKSQAQGNSTVIFDDSIMYSDGRTIVAKSNVGSILDKHILENSDENCIYIHYYTIKLFEFIMHFNNKVYFDDNFDVLYWRDDDTEILLCSDDKEVLVPDEEQLEDALPANRDIYVDVDMGSLKDCLDFFNGLFGSSNWKGIDFIFNENDNLTLRLKSLTTEVNKEIVGVIPRYSGNFSIDSDALKKVLTKMSDKYGDDSLIRIYYDSETRTGDECNGIYIVAGDDLNHPDYEYLMAQLFY